MAHNTSMNQTYKYLKQLSAILVQLQILYVQMLSLVFSKRLNPRSLFSLTLKISSVCPMELESLSLLSPLSQVMVGVQTVWIQNAVLEFKHCCFTKNTQKCLLHYYKKSSLLHFRIHISIESNYKERESSFILVLHMKKDLELVKFSPGHSELESQEPEPYFELCLEVPRAVVSALLYKWL